MNCPKCNNEMRNLGNVSGIIYTSYPKQWDDVHVCDECKIKINERRHGTLPPNFDYLKDYTQL